MYIIIENETNEMIYVDSCIGSFGIDFVEQEKIFYFSIPLYCVNIIYESINFINKINSFERKEILIPQKDIDSTKYRYVINDDGSVDKIYEGESEQITFCLFYTKEPFEFYGYKDYVNGIKNNGYFVIGYKKENKIIFNISDYTRITPEVKPYSR
jgi:hypothetical protein